MIEQFDAQRGPNEPEPAVFAQLRKAVPRTRCPLRNVQVSGHE